MKLNKAEKLVTVVDKNVKVKRQLKFSKGKNIRNISLKFQPLQPSGKIQIKSTLIFFIIQAIMANIVNNLQPKFLWA